MTTIVQPEDRDKRLFHVVADAGGRKPIFCVVVKDDCDRLIQQFALTGKLGGRNILMGAHYMLRLKLRGNS